MTQAVPKPQRLNALPLDGLPLRWPERRLILFVGDALLLLSSGLLALAAWAAIRRDIVPNREFISGEAPWLLGLSVAWLVLWTVNGGYDLRIASHARPLNRTLTSTALVFSLLYLLLFFFLSAPPASAFSPLPHLNKVRPLRVVPMLFIAFALVAELSWRNLYLHLLTGEPFCRRTLVIGAGRSGRTIAQTLLERGDGSYRIVGFVDDDPDKVGHPVAVEPPEGCKESAPASWRVLGNRHSLKDLIPQQGINTLILAITQVDGELLPILLDCLELGVEIVPMAVLYEELTGRVPVDYVGGSWYVAMPIQHPGTGSLYRISRRLMDIALSSLGLAFLGLALPVIALAIYLDSPGPIFYTQERVGKGGRTFRAFKFRSMVTDAERNGAVWAQQNDSRVTRVGRLLRKTHIDEFPQFLNILKGEMSAVGPRPERPEFVEELASEIPFYRIRHAVKPGMAGWGLVQQGYAASKEDVLLRLQYDLYYIKHQSWWLDTLILLKTIRDTLTLGGRA